MHLVNWDIVKRPVIDGGLQIRDPGLTNLAMGGKLLWQLFSTKNTQSLKFFGKNASKEELLGIYRSQIFLKALLLGIYAEED